MNFRITAGQLKTLRQHLIRPDGLERAAYLYCTREGDRLLTTAVHPVADEDMRHNSESRCAPDPDVELEHLNACSRSHYTPVLFHSHPFADNAWFSTQDDYLMGRYYDWLYDHPTLDIGFGVLAREGLIVDILENEVFTPMTTSIVGDWTLDTPVVGTRSFEEISIDFEVYDRSIRAFGPDSQRALAETHVAIVGCGGLGSQLALEATRLGVQKLTLIDPDRVEESNLPRLWGANPPDVGQPKVAVIQRACWRFNPDIEATVVRKPVQEAVNQLRQVDVILAGLDQLTPRVWLNNFAVRYLIPYIDAGARIEFDDEQAVVETMEGFVQTIAPGATACYDCLDRAPADVLHREQLSREDLEQKLDRGYIAETALSPAPAVVHLNGVVGSLAVSTLAQIVTGYEAPPGLQHYDNLAGTVTARQTPPAPTCATCGQVLGHGEEPVQELGFGDALPTASIEDVDPRAAIKTAATAFPAAVTQFFTADR